MSIVAFKKKSVIQYGSKRSGKPPGGIWLPQGPFGHSTVGLQLSYTSFGPVGFSLNGTHRNKGYIGKSSAMSTNGTPFRGQHALGHGGRFGTYETPLPVFNGNEANTQGNEWRYIKPTVLTTYGMLEKKYKWIKNGTFPNNVVQPNYTGNQTDAKSQGLYLHNLSASNMCVTDVNNTAKYIGNIKLCGPTLCSTSGARYKYNDMASNGPYTKHLNTPESSSEHTLRIQRKCTNPKPAQKPFPYGVSAGTGILTGSVGTVTNVGNSCNISKVYLDVPEWYLK